MIQDYEAALHGLTAEPGTPHHPVDKIRVLVAWAQAARAGTLLPDPPVGVQYGWTAAVNTAAVQPELERLEKLVDDARLDAAERCAEELIDAVDSWTLANWASNRLGGPVVDLAQVWVDMEAAFKAHLFTHLRDVAIAEVSAWRKDLGTFSPTLYRSSDLWRWVAEEPLAEEVLP